MNNFIKYRYEHEKLTDCMETFMLTSHADRKKIEICYQNYLSLIKKEKLPEELHEKFDYLKERLTGEDKIPESDKNNRYGAIFHASQNLNSSSIKKIKTVIWEMYSTINSMVKE